MQPKVILQLYPMLPAEGEEGRKSLRPLGRNAELYQKVLWDCLLITSPLHSCLNATIGSTRVARRAGTRQASSATSRRKSERAA